MLMLATTAAMIEQFNKNNILILEGMGYEVHVAGNWLEGNPISDRKLEEFKDWIRDHHGRWFHIPTTRRPTDIIRNAKAYGDVVNLIKKYRYAFIHCHTPIGSVIGRLAAARTGTKVIYTAHGFHFFKGAPLKNWLLYFPVEWFCSWMTDVLITINKEDYRRARKYFHAKHIEYIPGVGIDVAKFADGYVDKRAKCCELKIPDDKFILLSVGELQERKNYGAVIDVLGKMQDKDIYYLIAGQGRLKTEYERSIKKYGMEKNIILLGYRTDISELCEIADCFIHMAFHEGLSVALLEAMASGLPVIGSDVRGVKDLVVHNKGGICVNPKSSDEMHRAIRKMVSDRGFREKCTGFNLVKVKKYCIENIDEMMQKQYANACSGGHILRLIRRIKKRKEMKISEDDFVIISVGELNMNKNHRVIIKAVEYLKDMHIKYIVCGQGQLKGYLEQVITSCGLDKQVMLLGYRTDIKELLCMSDLFALPSKREGLGLAALEAMAVGLPLLTSDVHGINDYSIQGLTGYKENTDDYIGFAKAIAKCKGEQCDAYNRKKYIQKTVMKFDRSLVEKKMREIYVNEIG